MANHSAERPEGILTPSDLMDFFSYTKGADGSLIYTPGHEKIPEDWYKRAVTDPWTLADIVVAVSQQVRRSLHRLLASLTCLVVQCAAFPSTCAVGGNTGTVNSFAGVDPGDFSGGLFNAQAYTDPYKLGCLISQNVQAVRYFPLFFVLPNRALILLSLRRRSPTLPTDSPKDRKSSSFVHFPHFESTFADHSFTDSQRCDRQARP